ncbi:hypothetical protein ABMY26_36590 (plasmid) [Azospirillum sp. HJ39]|uniref:hypothetical protein n=1 Tax=Azospirillum sp. HJ39 TaxID=3159496 RepID=UPI003557323B
MSMLTEALARLRQYNLNPFKIDSNPFGLTGIGGTDTNLEPMLGDVAMAAEAAADLATAAVGAAAATAADREAVATDRTAVHNDRLAADVSAASAAGNATTAATEAGEATESAVAAAASATLADQYAVAAGGAIPAVRLTWDTGTADADPGNGKVRANNATPTAATALFVDNLDVAGVSITAVIDRWTASTNIVKGTLRVAHRTNVTKWMEYQVTGIVVDGTGYRKITVTGGTGPGGIANGDPVAVGISRAGDAGVTPSSFGAGTAAAPGWSVTGDSNTGLAQVGGADTLSLVVGGQELARLASALLTLNPGRAPISPAIWLMGPSVGEDYSFQRDPTGTGYLIFNGVQIAASGYSFRVNNGTERLRIPNTGPLELEATKFRGPTTAKQGAIAYAATLTLDFATYQDFVIGDLTGPLTLANPSTYPVGQRGEILLHEDATGGRTVSFGANWIKMGNGNVNTAASKYSIVVYWIAVSGYVHYSLVGGA